MSDTVGRLTASDKAFSWSDNGDFCAMTTMGLATSKGVEKRCFLVLSLSAGEF